MCVSVRNKAVHPERGRARVPARREDVAELWTCFDPLTRNMLDSGNKDRGDAIPRLRKTTTAFHNS